MMCIIKSMFLGVSRFASHFCGKVLTFDTLCRILGFQNLILLLIKYMMSLIALFNPFFKALSISGVLILVFRCSFML